VVVDNDMACVVDFASHKKIRMTTYKEFLRGQSSFGVVPYNVDAEAQPGHRERTVAVARAFLATPTGSLPVYNVITANCECFAWVCKSGTWRSDQIVRILRAPSHFLSNTRGMLREAASYLECAIVEQTRRTDRAPRSALSRCK
jgi:hypothetical protein